MLAFNRLDRHSYMLLLLLPFHPYPPAGTLTASFSSPTLLPSPSSPPPRYPHCLFSSHNLAAPPPPPLKVPSLPLLPGSGAEQRVPNSCRQQQSIGEKSCPPVPEGCTACTRGMYCLSVGLARGHSNMNQRALRVTLVLLHLFPTLGRRKPTSRSSSESISCAHMHTSPTLFHTCRTLSTSSSTTSGRTTPSIAPRRRHPDGHVYVHAR